jgi:Mannosyltransferase (PIG-V)
VTIQRDATAADAPATTTAAPTIAGAPTALPSRAEVRRAASYCFKVWAVVAIGLMLIGVVGIALIEPNIVADVPGWPAPEITPGWHNAITAYERWDALWYLRIASDGYDVADKSAAFFPGYPLLTRGFSLVTGNHPLAGGYIAANLACFLAFVVVYLMTAHEFDERRARQTVLLMAVFPTAFFFFAPFSESTFLLFAATSLFAARLGKWWIAALAGALAAATRSIGIALALPLFLEALRQIRQLAPEQRRPGPVLYKLACCGGPAVGIGAYLAYWQATAGDWQVPFASQSGWLREFSWPWETLYWGTKLGIEFIGSFPGGFHTLDLVIVAFAVLAMIWLVLKWVALKIPALYASYALVSFVIPLMLVFGGRPFMSLPRFLVVVWPIFWAFGAFADKFNARDLVVGASAAGLGAFALLFVNWYFIF